MALYGKLTNEVIDFLREKGTTPEESIEIMALAIGVTIALNVVETEAELEEKLSTIAETILGCGRESFRHRHLAHAADH
jgi:hypothetical protein